MKIVHIIPTLSSGGAERMLAKLVTYNQENQHTIITLLNGDVHYDISSLENITIIELGKGNNNLNKVLLVFSLLKYFAKNKTDIVQTWSKANYYGPIIKIFNTKLKVVSNFRNGYIGKHSRIKSLFFSKYFNLLDGHIFVSRSALYERKKSHLNFKNTIIINNGFELPTLSPLKNKGKELVFGHIGRLHPIKNQKNIVKAFQNFEPNKNTILVMAGKNLCPENLKLKNIGNSRIVFLGELLDVSKFYEMIDVLVLASKSEGFPNVIGEAMSYGKYIITTDAGESFDIIGDGGYKLKTGDVTSIQESFEYIYNNQDILEIQKDKNIEIIKRNYSINVVIKKYQEFYKSLGE